MFYDCLDMTHFYCFHWARDMLLPASVSRLVSSFPSASFHFSFQCIHSPACLVCTNYSCVHLFALRGALQYAECLYRRPNIVMKAVFFPSLPYLLSRGLCADLFLNVPVGDFNHILTPDRIHT